MTIPLFKVFMTPSAEVRVAEVLKSLYIGQGTKVDQFEEELKRTFQLSEEIITVNSGTSAIDLALHMIGVFFSRLCAYSAITNLPPFKLSLCLTL